MTNPIQVPLDYNKMFINGPDLHFLNNFIKRSMDIVISFIALLLLSPFFMLISILIKRDSPGPVIYRGKRMGRSEQPFDILKFRTMFERPQSYEGPKVTGKKDDRITPFGHWLRDTKVNELPQLWNVLVGDMSLVGPRPEDVDIARDWPEDARREILSVRPGITSPASILYHDEENLLSSKDVMLDYFTGILPDKMRLDKLYVRNHSFSSDIDIIFWTVIVILPNLVQTKIPEGSLYSGPISRLFRQYITWFVLDLLTSFCVFGIAALMWRVQMPFWGEQYQIIMIFVLAALFSGMNSIMGLNKIVWSSATLEDSMGLFFSGGISTVALLGLNYLQSRLEWLHFASFPAPMIFTIGLMATLSFIATRYRWRLVAAFANRWLSIRRGLSVVGEHVIIVGLGEGSETAAWLLRRKKLNYAFTYIGIVDDESYQKYGMWENGCQVLGGTSELPHFIKKYDVGLLLFTTSRVSSDTKNRIIDLCKESKIRLIFLDKFMKMLDQQLTPAEGMVNPEKSFELALIHDDVTGLPARQLFEDRLKKSLALAKRYHTHPAVLRIELPDIRSIEYRYGHIIKDKLIKDVAERLNNHVRESDTLARLGEYEFGIILENIADQETIELVKNRICLWFDEPFLVNRKNINLKPQLNSYICEEVYDEF